MLSVRERRLLASVGRFPSCEVRAHHMIRQIAAKVTPRTRQPETFTGSGSSFPFPGQPLSEKKRAVDKPPPSPGSYGRGRHWARFLANHHGQAIPRPAVASFFQVRALFFQVRSVAGQAAAGRNGLALFFQVRYPGAGGWGRKVRLRWLFPLRSLRLCEREKRTSRKDAKMPGVSQVRSSTGRPPWAATVWLCFFEPNHHGQVVLHQSAGFVFFQVRRPQAGCRARGRTRFVFSSSRGDREQL
jgi:hypothetical protein